jgi:SanA protein
VARGIPASDVIEDHAGFRTMDSMHRARAVFGVHDAIVCTQAFHLPRALYLARSFGIDAVGVVADRRPYRGAVWSAVRETIARPIAFIEVRLGHGARVLGPPA